MKNKWNHYGVAAMFTLAVGASLVLAGCGGAKTDTKAAAAVATNLSFNFETGEYSFTGVDKGRTYAIRLYALMQKASRKIIIPLHLPTFWRMTATQIMRERWT